MRVIFLSILLLCAYKILIEQNKGRLSQTNYGLLIDGEDLVLESRTFSIGELGKVLFRVFSRLYLHENNLNRSTWSRANSADVSRTIT